MRAAFFDAQGSRLARTLPYAASALAFLAACTAPVSGGQTLLLLAFAGSLFCLAGGLAFRPSRARAVELVCGPGHVDVKNAGLRSQRIEAKSIVGATTARTERGILLTLAHAKRDQPIEIEVESEADAERIRHALGIGHDGFGTVGWRTVSDGTAKIARTCRLVLAALGLLTCFFGWTGSEGASILMGILGFFAMTFAGPVSVAGYFVKPGAPSVEMTPHGVRLMTPRGWFNVPYADILGIETQQGWLQFIVPPPHPPIWVQTQRGALSFGVRDEDERALKAQILTAAARARGHGPRKEDVTGRVGTLRRNGENPRDWLVRLDMAGQMLSGTSGYRGHNLDQQDLWMVLEDPDAEAELRAAAARVLRHSPEPEARVRIGNAVAAVRDERANKRLRIAVEDDLDAATLELGLLDAEEHAQAQKMAAMSSALRPVR
ncbi:hypothetical protein AKJ09_11449 [Labilithrix luteola]|uniref:Uncharacterized protein n=1 Tax=Labilithrix luteola TaxID=1391654 RepID=A0A0K1QG95_9BACT|nr:hypothetical protein [Labilithrix luteola]AKV04786.1 hypothetical protein AKJ09_11449 [Labilithrix luteola]